MKMRKSNASATDFLSNHFLQQNYGSKGPLPSADIAQEAGSSPSQALIM